MEVEIRKTVEALVAILVVLVGSIVVKLFRDLIWTPYSFHKAFTAQGIRGPPYRILDGSIPEYRQLLNEAHAQPMQKIYHDRQLLNEAHAQPMQKIYHDIVPRIMPHYHKYSQIYGEPFFSWFGIHPRLYISEPELIKEVLSNKFGHYTKQTPGPLLLALLGRGLALVNGLTWVKHRRIVSPAFNIDKLKAMVKKMAACTSSMLDNWQEMVAQVDSDGKEIDVHKQFQALTVDIICHTAFGSSYSEGKEVFELQKELQEMAAKAAGSVFIPGSQYIPTRKNRHVWMIDRRIKEILISVIQSRLEPRTHVGYGNDLLGIMMTANQKELNGIQKNLSMTIDEIMHECKTFFFAGHETTSNLLTWAVFLLAVNPEWQGILRKEVISICGTDIPDADILSRMKSMTMVLNETLRLYPPANVIARKAYKKIKLGKFLLPKGTCMIFPILAVHHNEEFWGPEANLFRPERFAEGTSKAATHPNAFFPFSMGPRNCVGQNFAMLEAKTVLTMILQRLSFSISPDYKHAPISVITLQPQHGMQILFKSIEM